MHSIAQPTGSGPPMVGCAMLCIADPPYAKSFPNGLASPLPVYPGRRAPPRSSPGPGDTTPMPKSHNIAAEVLALVHRGWDHLRLQRPLAAWASWQQALRLAPEDRAA